MPVFNDDWKVKGVNIFEFLRWAQESFKWKVGLPPPDHGVLALPPIQRNAAWGPQQVVDLWDSIFRGLPLGAFMVRARNDGGFGRRLGLNARNQTLPTGWDLLDGQQRVRSLLLGLYGPDLEPGGQDKRCLWIDLDRRSDRYLFELRLTSASQPFGYDENGYKLAPTTRAQARRRFEGEVENEGDGIRNGDRQAYNHELFAAFIKGDPPLRRVVGQQEEPMPPVDYPKGWPPLPAQVDLTRLSNDCMILPLHEIFKVWICATGPKDKSLAQVVNPGHHQFRALFEALTCFDQAFVALINTSPVRSNDLPLLYGRIGAGGTRLSDEERLFSFYKSVCRDFHDIVCDIHEDIGRVMAPSQISASAIRVANARAHHLRDQEVGQSSRPNEGNGLPAVATFAEALGERGSVGNKVDL